MTFNALWSSLTRTHPSTTLIIIKFIGKKLINTIQIYQFKKNMVPKTGFFYVFDGTISKNMFIYCLLNAHQFRHTVKK